MTRDKGIKTMPPPRNHILLLVVMSRLNELVSDVPLPLKPCWNDMLTRSSNLRQIGFAEDAGLHPHCETMITDRVARCFGP